MPDSAHAPLLTNPVRIRSIGCRTALGDAAESVQALNQGRVGLKPVPVHGPDGGEEVPLALRGEMANVIPPRWWDDLTGFAAEIPGAGWGSARRPVMFTSSNYGIDGLYSLGKSRDARYAPWATAHGCVQQLVEHMGWGRNVFLYSHACVSAQLGLYQAARFLDARLADEVLVLSFDYVGPFVAAGFHALKILNAGWPAPYADRETGSIGLGDGVAYAILDKEADGPQIRAQALYNEMYHFTSNAPEGAGFQKALQEMAPLPDPGNFWIKGHGTGTLEAGKMEAETLHRLFPGRPLVSWKGSLGHTLGSCALVELALALEASRLGTIPGTVGSGSPCYSPDVRTASFTAGNYDSCLLLSNAFGGAHGAMLVSHA